MLWLIWLCFLSITRLEFAATNCPVDQFWNGTSCQPCATCPPGFGLKEKCMEKVDTECQPCWHGYDYSNSTSMEPCILCDKYSNCLAGNAKIIKNCTIFSGPVCKGCAEGSYFKPGMGQNGGCVECSPPCGIFEKEVRSCKTEHDRECSKQWTNKEIVEPSTPSVSWKNDPVSTAESVDVGDGRASEEATPLPEPSTTGEEPLHEKSWFWGAVIGGFGLVVVLPVVMFTVVKCRTQEQGDRNTSPRTTRPASTHGNDTLMQQRSPLMPRAIGLELPIKDLSMEQKRFIAQMLNDRDTYGHFYWERVADRVGLRNEFRSWSGLQNPTEALLTTYGEKSGSTVRTLIDALREDGLTHFADQIEKKFSTAQDDEEEETNRVDETAL